MQIEMKAVPDELRFPPFEAAPATDPSKQTVAFGWVLFTVGIVFIVVLYTVRNKGKQQATPVPQKPDNKQKPRPGDATGLLY